LKLFIWHTFNELQEDTCTHVWMDSQFKV